MKMFIFEGRSDDTFGEYEQTDDDYDNCASGTPIQWELKAPDGAGIIVTGLYCNPINKGDGWMIGVNTIDEHKSVEPWSLVLRPSHEGYHNQLAVLAPNDAKLRCLNREYIWSPTMGLAGKQTHSQTTEVNHVENQSNTAQGRRIRKHHSTP